MKLRELMQMLQATATEVKAPPVYLVGGCPRDKYLGKLSNIEDLDCTNGSNDIGYIAQELYNKLKKQFDVSFSTAEDGHSTIYIGNLKLDFSSNFILPNIDNILNSMKIRNITNMKREIYSRDFTCNTLLMDLSLKHIYDPTGHGFQDIKDKKIRTCLSPEITLTNSTNRVARAIYLATKLDFDIDHGIIDFVRKNPQTIQTGSQKAIKEKLEKAFAKNPDKASFYIGKMNLWGLIPITETMMPYYQKSLLPKKAYYMGGGGVNEPEPKRQKYKADKAILVQTRFKEPFYRNYDLISVPGMEDIGPGVGYLSMHNYDSIKDFIDAKRKRLKDRYKADDFWIEDTPNNYEERVKKMTINASIFEELVKCAIDYPIDDMYNRQDQMIYIDEESYQPPEMVGPDGTSDLSSFPSNTGTTDFGSYPYAAEIGWEKTPLHLPDFEGKSDADLNIGRDYDGEEELPSDLDPKDLAKLTEKYLTPAETDLFGLPDGMDPISDLDAERTIQTENPYTGISDISREMYSDESQERSKVPIL